ASLQLHLSRGAMDVDSHATLRGQLGTKRNPLARIVGGYRQRAMEQLLQLTMELVGRCVPESQLPCVSLRSLRQRTVRGLRNLSGLRRRVGVERQHLLFNERVECRGPHDE